LLLQDTVSFTYLYELVIRSAGIKAKGHGRNLPQANRVTKLTYIYCCPASRNKHEWKAASNVTSLATADLHLQ
jgi:hypothetical protein